MKHLQNAQQVLKKVAYLFLTFLDRDQLCFYEVDYNQVLLLNTSSTYLAA